MGVHVDRPRLLGDRVHGAFLSPDRKTEDLSALPIDDPADALSDAVDVFVSQIGLEQKNRFIFAKLLGWFALWQWYLPMGNAPPTSVGAGSGSKDAVI